MKDIRIGKYKVTYKSFMKWIAALRSGEYAQGRNQLESADGFCCLGVACKVLVPGYKKYDKPFMDEEIGVLVGMLPATYNGAPKWLTDINNDFQRKTNASLDYLNDDKKLTFNEIADCLEAVYVHKVMG